jgi:predicted nucleic acid-binding protein
MPLAVLDTNAVSDLMRDDPQVKARAAAYSDPLGSSVIVVGEIRYGLERLPVGKKRADLETRAARILGSLPAELVTESAAEVYGRLKATMESQGVNSDDNDLWIAATALVQNAIVVSRDQFFRSQSPLRESCACVKDAGAKQGMLNEGMARRVAGGAACV